jgi:hypothetical protein
MVEVYYNNWYAPLYCAEDTQLLTDCDLVAAKNLRLTHQFATHGSKAFKPVFEIDGYKPTFDLGYLVGIYAGYGSIQDNLIKFRFGNNPELGKQLDDLFKTIFNVDTQSSVVDDVLMVTIESPSAVAFFEPFGSKLCRSIPDEYVDDSIDYVNGLFDGLVEYNVEESVYTFVSLSKDLAETFLRLCKIKGFTMENNTLTLTPDVPVHIYSLIAREDSTNTNYSALIEYNFETISRQGWSIKTNDDNNTIIANNLVVNI